MIKSTIRNKKKANSILNNTRQTLFSILEAQGCTWTKEHKEGLDQIDSCVFMATNSSKGYRCKS